MIFVIPVANPPALFAGVRNSPIDGLDLNRSFPGEENGSATERLAFHLMRVLEIADVVISMHSWSAGYEVVPFVEHQTTEPGRSKSEQAARALGLEFVEPMAPRPGRLLTSLAHRDITTIECEIGGLAATFDHTRNLYQRAFFRLLAHVGIRRQGQRDPTPNPRFIRRVDVVAEQSGFLTQHAALGGRLSEGDVIAHIADFSTGQEHPVRSPIAGWLGIRRATAVASPGDLLAGIFVEL
jgi:N-alpha-acetyl-L-2,4-diaminobutyrate deacetylase